MATAGIECISSSPALLLLFEAAMDWIQSTWNRDKNDLTVQIHPKEIGRQEGFIVDVSTSNPDRYGRYFAKAQAIDMSYETVLVHHILRLMKCGPDTFCFPVLDGLHGIKQGVITAEVDGFTMASAFTEADQDNVLFNEDDCLSSTFLLTILVQLGRFSNIPNNIDNWGYVPIDNAPMAYPHLALVDFSSCGDDPGFFLTADAFEEGWLNCIDKIACSWNVTGNDAWIEQRTKLLSKLVVTDQIRHFPFLQSQQALTELLQTAVNQTALWLQKVVHNARQANAENLHTNIMPSTNHNLTNTMNPTNTNYAATATEDTTISTSTIVAPSATPISTHTTTILTPFQQIPCPDTTGLDPVYIDLIDCNHVLVRDLNTDLTALFQWFPFYSGGGGVSRNTSPINTAKVDGFTDDSLAQQVRNAVQEEHTNPIVQATSVVEFSTTSSFNYLDAFNSDCWVGSGIKRDHSQLDTAGASDV